MMTPPLDRRAGTANLDMRKTDFELIAMIRLLVYFAPGQQYQLIPAVQPSPTLIDPFDLKGLYLSYLQHDYSPSLFLSRTAKNASIPS